MIYPTPSDLLRCIDLTLLEAADLDVPRMSVKSALASCRHLVRHVVLRQELDASLLLDDIEKTTDLLKKIGAYLDTTGEARDVTREIRFLLAETPSLLTGSADDLDRIRARALALRERIYGALRRLQSLPDAAKSTEPYRETRRLIRDYIAYEIAQEERTIGAAFAGKGPRR